MSVKATWKIHWCYSANSSMFLILEGTSMNNRRHQQPWHIPFQNRQKRRKGTRAKQKLEGVRRNEFSLIFPNTVLVHLGSNSGHMYYLWFHQSSLIPWQEACPSSPLRVAFQYWGFLSREKQNKTVIKSTGPSLHRCSLKAYLLTIRPPLPWPQFIMTSSTNW